ncbi:hypothetical protein GCM10009555_007160 [Acrocarpospora macrocephala]|uniref:Plastocyanin-like domain-containing protein n=1 Tax=Acrocarpospora macrocephala TaxID=150177 RepID=A0A5M3X2Z4_9ACTN|nr:hypothetical protein [Acrocarpospora macrocephala]GES13183.1 hypothetical protein Amac_067800 [Acrocarpospora macrocephala]
MTDAANNDSVSGFPTTPGDELIFENDRVRVWAMNLEPGGMFDFHVHEHDHLILWPDAGRAQGQEYGQDDWHIIQNAERGFAIFKTLGRSGPLPPHRLRNLEDHAVTHYIIELISEESPSEGPLPTQTNGRGTTTRPHTVVTTDADGR